MIQRHSTPTSAGARLSLSALGQGESEASWNAGARNVRPVEVDFDPLDAGHREGGDGQPRSPRSRIPAGGGRRRSSIRFRGRPGMLDGGVLCCRRCRHLGRSQGHCRRPAPFSPSPDVSRLFIDGWNPVRGPRHPRAKVIQAVGDSCVQCGCVGLGPLEDHEPLRPNVRRKVSRHSATTPRLSDRRHARR